MVGRVEVSVKFVSLNQFRSNSGKVRGLIRNQDLILTAKGSPIGFVIGVDEDNFEETASLLKKLRAQKAVAKMRRDAKSAGASELSSEEINQEIAAVRNFRKS